MSVITMLSIHAYLECNDHNAMLQMHLVLAQGQKVDAVLPFASSMKKSKSSEGNGAGGASNSADTGQGPTSSSRY